MGRVLLSTSRWGKTEKLLYDTLLGSEITCHCIYCPLTALKKKRYFEKYCYNIFILEIEYLDIFHHCLKEDDRDFNRQLL